MKRVSRQARKVRQGISEKAAPRRHGNEFDEIAGRIFQPLHVPLAGFAILARKSSFLPPNQRDVAARSNMPLEPTGLSWLANRDHSAPAAQRPRLGCSETMNRPAAMSQSQKISRHGATIATFRDQDFRRCDRGAVA